MATREKKITTDQKKKEPSIEEKWESYSRALIVTAHPDDAEFIAGGTIAKLASMGMDVAICVATSGDKGTRDINLRPQELAAMREEEQRQAAKALGIARCFLWGMSDGFLEETHDLRRQVVRLIRSFRPDVMITWDGYRPGFNHNDHRVIGRVVRDALYPAAHDPHYFPELTRAGIGPHRTAELLLAATHEPDYHVDIGSFLEQKADAILCHRSQISYESRDAILRAWRDTKRMRETRKRTGFAHSESFKRMEFRRPPGAPGTPPPRSAKTVRSR